MELAKFSKCGLFLMAFSSLGLGGCNSLASSISSSITSFINNSDDASEASALNAQKALEDKEEANKKLHTYLASVYDSAMKGRAPDQYLIGNMFMTGQLSSTQINQLKFKYGVTFDNYALVEQNDNKAEFWFKKAAEQDHYEAQARLAMMYFEKRIAHTDPYKEGMKWAQRAIKNTSNLAKALVCIAYMDGNGVKKSYDQAFNYLKTADLAGVDSSLPEYKDIMDHIYNLGDAFLKGKSVKKNTSKALTIFEKLSDAEYLPGTIILAKVYQGEHGVKRDVSKALSYGLKAEFGGATDLAVDNAAILYRNPKLLRQTDISLVDMVKNDLKKLISSGNNQASFALYKLLDYVKDDSFSLKDRLVMLVNAASDNIPEAKTDLDKFHKLIEQKEAEANQGDIEKMIEMAYFYSEIGLNGTPDPVKCVYFVRKAVNKGSPKAMMLLASFYYQGIKLPKDFQMAVSLVNQAASMGYPPAVQWMNNYNQQVSQYQMAQPEAQQMLQRQQLLQQQMQQQMQQQQQQSVQDTFENFGKSVYR